MKTPPNIKTDNAIDFHSDIASQFDDKYTTSTQFVERKKLWESVMKKHSHPKHRALDLGCGSGVFTEILAKLNQEVVGVDGSPEMLSLCRSRLEKDQISNVRLLELDVSAFLKSQTGQFDLIICSSVLEYLDNFEENLSQLKRLLAPQAILIFSIPNGSSWYRKLEPWFYRLFKKPRYYRYVKTVKTLEQVKQCLSRNGLVLKSYHYFGHTPLLSKAFKSRGGAGVSENMLLVEAGLFFAF